MKRVFLIVFMLYVSQGQALIIDGLNDIQDDSLVQQVAEGLNPEEPPPELMKAWRATFLFVFVDPTKKKDARVGSAFVVGREVNADTQTLDLLTADHVLESWCDHVTCRNLYVFDSGIIATKGTVWTPRTRALSVIKTEVVDREAGDDLALVRITVRASFDVEPVTFAATEARSSEAVYALGYPKVYLRPGSTDPEPNVIRRRWSEGEVLGVRSYGRMLAGEYLTTDADALPGNSGGPVVNADGEVTGVLGITGSQPATSFAYVDTPYGANQGVQGAAVRLARVTAFLARANAGAISR